MNETTLSRVLTAISVHDVWLTLRQTLRGHASTALAYENEIHPHCGRTNHPHEKCWIKYPHEPEDPSKDMVDDVIGNS